MTDQQIREQIEALGPWFYEFDLGEGRRTPSSLPPEVQPIHQTRLGMVMGAVKDHFGTRLAQIRAIDVGCHEGFYSVALAREGVKSVLGVDVREGNLAKARFVGAAQGSSEDTNKVVAAAAAGTNVAAIPLAEVAAQAEAAFASLQSIEGNLSADDATLAIQQDLPVLTRESSARLEESSKTLSSNPSLPTLSRALEGWTGLRGHVQVHVSKIVEERAARLGLPLPQPAVDPGISTKDLRFDIYSYICGLNFMVSGVRELLTGYGWHRKQIVFERYD